MSQFHITVQPTSNENIVKFVTNSFLTQAKSYEFNNIDEAKPSPLAQQLFYLPFVKTVYISQNFIAIEKYNIVGWDDVKEEVAASISEYLESGKVVIEDTETTKKVPVTVYAESTPNPIVQKFVANKPLADGTFEFKNIDDAIDSPLATALFAFPFVKEVFISANYVSVMKYNVAEWQEISMELREFIRSYIENGKPILNDAILQKKKEAETAASLDTTTEASEAHSDIDKEIMAILDEYIKPAVASDGGHIAFDSFDVNTKTVRVILQGACSGCPSSTITLKNGIETMLKDMLNGRVQTVEAING
ncbi:NifU family protein [Ulvibacter litoralis]|uniref:Fe-S cluster biogenesis protein NfuA, 4Fe-4S-binding domain n=1 Tax=Ulvibacter litoralis TaxID=227084 RepID=A0A1G7DWG7_9FLAO|nr:NifU family protein [Ulvibacter litoralis]GHC42015.1 NifU family protein [Ulvibacter litoralis]SDE55742.1 Fe-S cluster biogenesis protein NfuA, 4Fe-4S-binding domain [Ulvibacter litoralis]